MQPTYLKYIKNAVKLPLKNITEYYPNEVFTEVIFYDGRILPWYYISNYGRVYSTYTSKLLSLFIDERNKVASIIRLIRRGQTYLDISKQYYTWDKW